MNNLASSFKKTTLLSALLLEITVGAQAASISVDGVTCNLNDAMLAANTDVVVGGCIAGTGADELNLTTGVFNLTASTVSVTTPITVNANNSTIQPDPGGGGFRLFTVQVGGELTINDAILANGESNSVDRNYGAGVRAYDGVLNINRSTITGNLGGAVMFTRSTGSLIDSVVDGNDSFGSAALFYGGGVSIGNSTVTISNSTISNNNTTSGIAGGGGIYVTNYGGSDVIISNTTISGNTSENAGGGIFHRAYGVGGTTMTLTNVTLVNNTSMDIGGGLSNDVAIVTISQSLISGNSGAGGREIATSGGTITVDDYNIFGLNSDAGVVGVTVGASDIVPTEVLLTDIIDVNLIDNGGFSPTHALADDSPAIDAVPNASCALMTDQTGKERPLDGDNDMSVDCDIGAFEMEGNSLDVIFEDDFDG